MTLYQRLLINLNGEHLEYVYGYNMRPDPDVYNIRWLTDDNAGTSAEALHRAVRELFDYGAV
jgi:hypothetical protein